MMRQHLSSSFRTALIASGHAAIYKREPHLRLLAPNFSME